MLSNIFNVNGYTFRASNSAIFIFVHQEQILSFKRWPNFLNGYTGFQVTWYEKVGESSSFRDVEVAGK